VRRERSERAAAFGTYPTASAAAVTFASVSGFVRIPFSARDAEAIETFASFATVVIVGAPSSVGLGDLGMITETVYCKRLQRRETVRCARRRQGRCAG
jgi:hypothetical protein